MGRQGRVGGPPPQGPVPVLAGLMDGNGCSIGTHILSYKPVNDSITPDDLVVFGIEPLFKENKSYNKGNYYGRNGQKQNCQLMLLASFT